MHLLEHGGQELGDGRVDVDGAERCVSTGAPAYMRSRTAWTASSPSMPRIAAPRISRVSASASTLMKPCVSPCSTARLTLVIGRVPTSTRRPEARASASVMPHAPERRVGEERVGRQAVGHLAVAAVEQVRGDDLVVVVGGVGEGAAAVALAERPDAGDAGGEPVVDAG